MKNAILLTITALSNIVFIEGVVYLLDEKYYGVDDRYWQTALTGLLFSTVWICLFIYANSRQVERFFKTILQKGANVYARCRSKIKRIHRKTS